MAHPVASQAIGHADPSRLDANDVVKLTVAVDDVTAVDVVGVQRRHPASVVARARSGLATVAPHGDRHDRTGGDASVCCAIQATSVTRRTQMRVSLLVPQNPSITYMALTARACARAVELMKRNEL